ncbi:hypothetical protein DL764_004467 [Monosporascus ibericus]|uniref:Phospholipase/carboxylesterase/thioesterase domain-containing protein n=1 Tax=Monosporascus ibericus TaxID=155417 RepID=A0A4Q4TCH0_9PEZI|nr:hypothetical protein DL764_004467 [Monosporascus ibericus]
MGQFGPLHVIQPRTEHSQTAVMLHGLGSTGEEFAEELFASNLSNGSSLRDEFPGCRWVFPSSTELWSSTFQEDMPAWFEAPSLTDTTAGQDLQAPGIRDSVAYLCGILNDEISLVGGRPERVVLGGISQGGAIAMWTLLCHPKSRAQGLCAFVGASTWLPFAGDIEAILSKRPTGASPAQTTAGDLRDFVEEMVAPLRDGLYQTDSAYPLLRTPVFMGHGSDDAYVDIKLGREAASILSSIGFSVEWKSYSGAEQEGHWLKVPEEVDDIRAFLAGAMTKGK